MTRINNTNNSTAKHKEIIINEYIVKTVTVYSSNPDTTRAERQTRITLELPLNHPKITLELP
jgi:hypothetical protein